MPAAALLVLQATLELTGLILGPDGKPFAKATLRAGAASTQSDAKGRFRLKLPEGVNRVVIQAEGMEAQEREVRPGEPLFVKLEPKVSEDRVEVVEGSAYGSEGTPSATLTRLEIYATPGAAADVFQAAKALPGVSHATEGAELFVRGGRPDEVGIFLNGGHMRHPYHHPTTQGGIFSSVDTAMVTTLNFIPGGFSARYGDALSAVMDLATDGATVRQGGIAVLNLAGQNVQIDQPAGTGLLRASLRYSNTTLLDRWFGLERTFEEVPISTDGHVAWQMPVGSQGRLSLMGLGSRDHLAVETRIANRADTFRNRSDTDFVSATYTQATDSGAAFTLTVSGTDHGQAWTFGPWGIAQRERSAYHRLEALLTPTPNVAVELGTDGEHSRLAPRGQVPLDTADWTPGRPARTFAYDFSGQRDGLYATVRWHLGSAWGLSLGGRTDRYSLLSERTRDLRATLSWRASSRVTVRFAGGTFHQAPDLTLLDPYMGNPDLKTLRATHALAAMEAREDGGSIPWLVRLEVYRKRYDRLVVEPVLRHYEGNGEGTAHGVDLLLKMRRDRLRAWLGYGWMQTRRREGRQLVLGEVPTSIPHNVTAVVAYSLPRDWELATTYRMASGAPVTPILGGTPDGQGGWFPIEGMRYSDRLPTHQRLDLRLSHYFSAGKRLKVVAFVEGLNMLNRRNVSGYTYTPDFSERRSEASYFSRRLLVGGLTLMW